MSSSQSPASPRVLRIPRSDEPDAHVLVHVSPVNSTDLTLAATEGEYPYIGSVTKSKLKNLRGKNYQGSDDEWAQIVSYALGQLPSADEQDWATGVETSASISGSEDEDKKMIITIRKRIQSITQRLGSITLKEDDEQSLELFDWCASAVARADSLESQVSSLSTRYAAAEDTISKLNRQLEEFIRAKDDDQNNLIANFAQLLNEKKLKIRNQQRVLTAAKVDPSTVPELPGADTTSPKLATRSNRPSKRTAREMSADKSESEDGFEDMEVEKSRPDKVPEEAAEETADEQPSTPQPLEEEDTTTDEDEPKPPQIEGKPGVSDRPGAKAPPPRRDLPFTRRDQGGKQAQTQSQEAEKEAEETAGETDDDEL